MKLQSTFIQSDVPASCHTAAVADIKPHFWWDARHFWWVSLHKNDVFSSLSWSVEPWSREHAALRRNKHRFTTSRSTPSDTCGFMTHLPSHQRMHIILSAASSDEVSLWSSLYVLCETGWTEWVSAGFTAKFIICRETQTYHRIKRCVSIQSHNCNVAQTWITTN